MRRALDWCKAFVGAAVFLALFAALVVVGLFRDLETDETLYLRERRNEWDEQ